jgi:DNA-binding transcriptional regulator YhcF (GntR family)
MNRHIDWTMGLRANVCARFRSAIADGLLTPRDRIPSARALAKGIGFG